MKVEDLGGERPFMANAAAAGRISRRIDLIPISPIRKATFT